MLFLAQYGRGYFSTYKGMPKMPSNKSQQISNNNTTSTNATMQLTKPKDSYGFVWTLQNI
jgi:hypothetical protein